MKAQKRNAMGAREERRWEEEIACSRILVSSASRNSGIACCVAARHLDVCIECGMGFGWSVAEGEDSLCLEWMS
jgi:hypothetical protein